jgi:protein SCO1/2
MRRALAWTVLGAALVAALAIGLTIRSRHTPASRVTTVVTGPPIGGPFQLVDQAGAKVDQNLLLGKWSAVFFGYTYCPDVCPTTLAALGQATTDLGAADKRFQVVFITVDPARDTPRQLGQYLSSATFPKGAIGLTGSPAQIAQAARDYHVFYQKVPQGASYVMDHTAVVYLMDPTGRFVEPLDLTAPPANVARQIETAMKIA